MNATLNLLVTYNVVLEIGQYSNNGATAIHAIDTEDGADVCTVSINIPGYSENLPAGVFYGKHWSENEGLLEQLEEQGVIVPVPDVPMISVGFITGIRAYRLLDK